MLVGSFRFDSSSNQTCPANITEYTDLCNLHGVSYTLYAIFCLATISVLLNTLCLVKLSQKKRPTVMRRNLLLLSATECAFSLTLVIDYSLYFSNYCRYNQPSSIDWIKLKAPLATIILVICDTTLCTRNWCNVLISAARTEVILHPLKSWKIFSRTRVVIYYFIILLVSLTLSVLRYVKEKFFTCKLTQPNNTEQLDAVKYIWNPEPDEIPQLSFIYFCFQVALPLFFVIIMTMLIIYQVAPWSHKAIIDNATRRRHHRKATNTVLLLAFIFTIFETPTFVFATIELVNKFFNVKSVFYTQFMENNTEFIFISELCVVLDSMFNFIAYSTAVPEIRKQLECIFCQLCRYKTVRRNGCLALERKQNTITIANDFSNTERMEAMVLNKATQKNDRFIR